MSKSSYRDRTSNVVDALNYATIYALNKEGFSVKRFFSIITSSTIPSSAYRENPWGRERLDRSPIDIAYMVEKLREDKDLDKNIREVNKNIKYYENIVASRGETRYFESNHYRGPITQFPYDEHIEFLKKAASIPQKEIEQKIPIEDIYELGNIEGFWKRVEKVSEDFKAKIEKAERILERFIKPLEEMEVPKSFRNQQEVEEKRWK